MSRPVLVLLLVTMLGGCSSKSLDSNDGGGAGAAAEDAWSAVRSAKLREVYTPSAKVALSATGLAFNPTIEGELWVTLRQFPSGKPCTMQVDTGCAALPGVVAVISNATSDKPRGVLKQDGNAWHFMRRPTALAWGAAELFGSCGEARTDNYEDEASPYAGPVLWSSSPEIFGVTPAEGQNGTHLDMLHETPFCMGIAHERGNAFWTFNGDAGSLDRVDFHKPHQIGGEDHSDGEVFRYVSGQLLRVPEVPSHLAYDSARGVVYVADTGHGRVLRVDPSTASRTAEELTVYELLADSGIMEGATVTELVPPGRLQQPSGLALAGDTLYVGDTATGVLYALSLSGEPQRILSTGLAAGELGGVALGPDGELYVTSLTAGSVQRVEAL